MLSFLGWLFLAGLGAFVWAFRGLAAGLGGALDTPREPEAGGWLPGVPTWRHEDDLADRDTWDEGFATDWDDDASDDEAEDAWEAEDSFGGYDDFDAGGYDGGGYDGGYDA